MLKGSFQFPTPLQRNVEAVGVAVVEEVVSVGNINHFIIMTIIIIITGRRGNCGGIKVVFEVVIGITLAGSSSRSGGHNE